MAETADGRPEGRRRIVVGTAGHIDHGKTSLVAALTGVDCDRWEEEKRRGITIDLGFAHLMTADQGGASDLGASEDLQIGFVDVPGHERFVHNALAGLGGIRLMMLVVAADEGVKPQTREHLAICQLLRIPAGVVALTKADLVEEELLELAQLELEEELQDTVFEGSPIVAVSSRTGVGLDDLRRVLIERAAAAELDETRVDLPARLPVDRAFHLQGLGVLVTGTLHAGTIAVGDQLLLEPGERPVRVRSVQVHGGERQRALAGERTSLQLVGVDLGEVGRGDAVVARPLQPAQRLLVRFRLLDDAPEALRVGADRPLEVRFHLLSAERLGKLRLLPDSAECSAGGEAVGELVLEEPVIGARGDRFVLRRPSPQTTLGGGEILDPHWRPPRRRTDMDLRSVDGLGRDDDSAIVWWVERAEATGVDAQVVAARLAVTTDQAAVQLRELAADGQLLHVPAGAGRVDRWVAPGVVRRLGERATKLLADFVEGDRLSLGMPKARLVQELLTTPAQPLADVYLEWLAAQRVLEVDGDLVNPPGRGGISKKESELAGRIVAAFEAAGLTPGSPPEICRELGAKQQMFDGLVKHLTSKGQIVRLPAGLFVARRALDELAVQTLAEPWDEFKVPEFKDRFGLSRKWAIPLLEWLDRQRVTVRRGDVRLVLRPRQ